MISPARGQTHNLKLHTTDLTEGRRKKRPKRGRSKLTLVLLTVLLVYMVYSLGSQFGHLAEMQKNVSQLQQQVSDLKQKNATMNDQIKKIQSQSYVEQTAREKLGLVKPGETVVVPTTSTSGQQGQTQAQPNTGNKRSYD